MWDMTHSYMWHDSFICVSHDTFDMLYSAACTRRCYLRPFVLFDSYVWNDSCIRMTWLVNMCDVSHCTAQYIRGSAVCDPSCWLIHTCEMTHAYMWNDSCIRVKWLINVCDVTHCTAHIQGGATRDPSCCLIYTCDMTHACDMAHAYVWHDLFAQRGIYKAVLDATFRVVRFIYVTWLIFVTWLIYVYVCGVTQSTAWHIRGGARRDVSRS